MSKATHTDIEDARIAALSKENGFNCFYDLRDWLDIRFPHCTFTLEQEEDIWMSIPDKVLS